MCTPADHSGPTTNTILRKDDNDQRMMQVVLVIAIGSTLSFGAE